LAELVKVIADPEMEDQYRTRGTYPVSVEVATRDGSRYQHRVDFAKGDPKNPMRPDELVSKFVQLAEPSLGKSQADQVLDAIAGLDREAEIQGFVNSLTPRALVA
jgi:2-methylcitrate dehydratase PrpD